VLESDRNCGQHAHFDVELFLEALDQVFKAFHGLLALRAGLNWDDKRASGCDRIIQMSAFSGWRIGDEDVILVVYIGVL
jgi:hypothetical protein